MDDRCKSVGLTPTQFGVLTAMRSSPGLDQPSLSRALGFDKVTVQRVLRGLGALDFVARALAPESRRILAVVLSPAGEVASKSPKTRSASLPAHDVPAIKSAANRVSRSATAIDRGAARPCAGSFYSAEQSDEVVGHACEALRPLWPLKNCSPEFPIWLGPHRQSHAHRPSAHQIGRAHV